MSFDTDLKKWMTDALNVLAESRFHLNLSGFDSILCLDHLWFLNIFLDIITSEYKHKSQT